MLDLLDHHRCAGGDYGNAREMLLALGLRHREAFDVVTAAREQSDDAGEHPGFVLHQYRERVRLVRVVPFLDEVGRCGLVHEYPLSSVMPAKAGIHVFGSTTRKAWMAGTSPAMTEIFVV